MELYMKKDKSSSLFLLAAGLLLGFAFGEYNLLLYIAIAVLVLAVFFRYYQKDKQK